MDRSSPYRVLPRGRWHLDALYPADHFLDRRRGYCRMGGDPTAYCTVHGGLSDYGGVDDRGLLCPGFNIVLSVLGSDAGADVSDHRHLGRQKSSLRSHQVFSLHPARFVAHAGGIYLLILCCRQYLQHPGISPGGFRQKRSDTAFSCLPLRIRGQSTDGPCSHMASRCPCRGANRRFSHSGGHHAENGCLWLLENQFASCSRCVA